MPQFDCKVTVGATGYSTELAAAIWPASQIEGSDYLKEG
jgi:hypothetical protein